MRRNKAVNHISVKQALAFSKGSLNRDIVDPIHFVEPTVDDCVRFIGWHSAGEYISYPEFRERPGLCRLVEGWNAMGMVMGLVTDPWSWAYGFKHGWDSLSDFDGENFDEIKTPMAVRKYKDVFGMIPSCFMELAERVGVTKW